MTGREVLDTGDGACIIMLSLAQYMLSCPVLSCLESLVSSTPHSPGTLIDTRIRQSERNPEADVERKLGRIEYEDAH